MRCLFWRIAVVVPFLTGCFPMRIIERPGLTGTVVSASSSLPISGANVVLGASHSNRGAGTSSTDVEGHFTIAPIRRWILYIVPMDLMGFSGNIQIEASGYSPIKRPLISQAQGPISIDVGTIALVRVP